MKYYYRDHRAGYQMVEREGKNSWGEIHGHLGGFEHPHAVAVEQQFSSRSFLEQVLPQLDLDSKRPLALELGCGKGQPA